MNKKNINKFVVFVFTLVWILGYFNPSSVMALDTGLGHGFVYWESAQNRLRAEWSPVDNDCGGDPVDSYSGWSCGDCCVDEGQEQYLKPYIILFNESGGEWRRENPPPIHWFTSPEGWDPAAMPYNEFYHDMSDLPDGNYQAQFCLIIDNITDPGDGAFPCGAKIFFTKGAGPVCGNGAVETGEQCDDGNTNNGDGCSSTCQTEVAPPAPSGDILVQVTSINQCGNHTEDVCVLQANVTSNSTKTKYVLFRDGSGNLIGKGTNIVGSNDGVSELVLDKCLKGEEDGNPKTYNITAVPYIVFN